MGVLDAVGLHRFLVHFPIALWLFGTVWWWIGLVAGRVSWRELAWIPLTVAAIAAIPTALAGQRDLARWELVPPVLVRHQFLGNLLPWLLVILVLIKAHSGWRPGGRPLPDWLWAVLLTGVAGTVIATAAQGGQTVSNWLLAR